MVDVCLNLLWFSFLNIVLTNARTNLLPINNVFDWDINTACVLVDDNTASQFIDGKDSEPLSLVRYENIDACKPMPKPKKSKNISYMIAVYASNCKLEKMVQNAQKVGARRMMVVANLTKYPARLDIGKNTKDFSVMVINASEYNHLLETTQHEPDIKLQLRSSTYHEVMQYSYVILPLLAIFSILAGMLFSVHSRLAIDPIDMNLKSSMKKVQTDSIKTCGKHIICYVFLIICIILFVSVVILLYFFYDYFAWVKIFVVCFAYTEGFCVLITEVIIRLSSSSSNDRWRWEFSNGEHGNFGWDIRGLFCMPVCVIPPIILIIFRDTKYIWILQDICGISACIAILRLVRFTKLKVVTILAVLLLIFDIFMVYIIPLLVSPIRPIASFENPFINLVKQTRTKRSTNGRPSVLQAVATGDAGTSGVRLSTKLLFPVFSKHAKWADRHACVSSHFYTLGLGDIILPGIVVAFAHRCDFYLRKPKRHFCWLYSFVAVIGYVMGFSVIEILLYIKGTAQPVLQTLSPFTVLPVVIVACIRREFTVLWRGEGPLGPQQKENSEKTKKHEADEKTSLTP